MQIITAMILTLNCVNSQQELSTKKSLSHSANCSGKLGGVGGYMEHLILAINDKLTSFKYIFSQCQIMCIIGQNYLTRWQ